MPKINLATLPELRGFLIITSQDELIKFLGILREDHYPLAELKRRMFYTEVVSWLKSSKPNCVTFLAVHNEKDDFAKNDSWGYHEMFKGATIVDDRAKVHVFKNSVEKFWH